MATKQCEETDKMTIMVGQTIGHYQITEKLGSGGMGEVYKAKDLHLDRFVALKFLSPELRSDKEARLRFKNEAKIISTLDHPNIAAIHDIEEINDFFFITMGYYAGQTLEECRKTKALSFDQIYSMVKQIACGLAEAHDAGITHRDIKPSNIMITKKDEVKILDFGLAKSLRYEEITQTDTILGTISYMSPEQIEGKPVDHRSDIFSFGALLYTMITGENPFGADYDVGVLYSIMNEEPRPIQDVRSDTPEQLQAVVSRALAKEPEERFQSVREIGTLIEQLQAGDKTVAVDISSKHRFSLHQYSWRVIASVAFLVTAVILFLVFRPTGPAPSSENSVAVMPFRYEGDDADWQWLGVAVSELINNELEHYPTLRKLGPAKRKLLVRELGFSESGLSLEQSVQVARRSKANLVLVGTLTKDKETLQVEARLVNTESTTLVDEFGPFEYNYGKLNQIASQISENLVSTFDNGALRQTPVSSKEKAVPVSLDAMRSYIEGQDAAYDRRSKEAIAKLTTAISLDSSFIRSYYLLSWVYSTSGDKAKAKEILLKGKPFIENLSLDAKLTYLSREALIDRRLQDCITYLEELISLKPFNASLHSNYGWIQYNNFRNIDTGIAAIHKCLQLDPTYSYAYWVLAYAYLEKGDKENALSMIQKYVDLNPGDVNPLTEKAGILNYIGEYESAISLSNRALALQSQSSSAQLALAKAYYGLGEFSRAHGVFERLKKQDLNKKDESESQARQARVFYQQAKYGQALDLVGQAIALDSTNLEGHWLRGRILLKLNDESAVREQVRLLSLALDRRANLLKDKWFLYNLQGELAIREGKLHNAIELFRRAMNLGPTERDLFLLSLANAYDMTDQAQKAVETYHSALKFNPNNAIANYRLAQAYEKIDKRDEASHYYKRVEQIWSGADGGLAELEIAREKSLLFANKERR